MKIALIFLVLSLSITLQAQWFTGTGSNGLTEATNLYNQIGFFPSGYVLQTDGKTIDQIDNDSLTNEVGKQFRRGRNLHQKGDADYGLAADWTTGNNATFDGGGALAGTFTAAAAGAGETIDGPRVYKYVQAAGSLNDYIASTSINIPEGFLGRTMGYTFDYKYDGNDRDIEWEVKCIDGGSDPLIVSSGEKLLPKQDNTDDAAIGFEVVFTPSTACTSVKIGPSVAVLNNGAILLWSEGVLTPDPLQFSERIETDTVKVYESTSHGSTDTKIRRFLTVQIPSNGKIIEYNSTVANGTTFTLKRNANCTISYGDVSASSGFGQIGISRNSTQLTTNVISITPVDRLAFEYPNEVNGNNISTSWAGDLNVGDIIRPHTNSCQAYLYVFPRRWGGWAGNRARRSP